MKGKYEYILIDGNNVGYSAIMSGKWYSEEFHRRMLGMSFKYLFYTIKLLYFNTRIYVLWDGKNVWRYNLYPEYKAKRREVDPEIEKRRQFYYEHLPKLKDLIEAMGVNQLEEDFLEADDLAYYFVNNIEPDVPKTLFSNDHDWWQMVRKGVVVKNTDDYKTSVNLFNFKEKTGYESPEFYLKCKILMGDKSDNIKGVGGVGEARAKQCVAKHPNFEDYFNGKVELKDCRAKWERNLVGNQDAWNAYELNKALMDLSECPYVDDSIKCRHGNLNRDKILELFEYFNQDDTPEQVDSKMEMLSWE